MTSNEELIEITPKIPNAAPLGLPEGSIRSLLALIIVLGGMILLAIKRLEFTDFLAMSGTVTALYFGQYIKSPQG
jgi:hypothetical protein